MWIVTALINGERRELVARVIERDEPPSLEQVREAAADLMPRAGRLLRYLDTERRITQESQRFVRSFDAVQRWSAQAEAESRDFNAVRDRFVSLTDTDHALGYFSSPGTRDPAHPDAVVWHAHTLVVVSVPEGVEQIDLEYRPEPRDAARLESLTARFRTSAHVVETILDARTCRGTDSELIDHFRAMRARGHGFFTSIRGTADMLVGRILNRVTTLEPAPPEDMTFQPRLRAMEREWRELSRACPDIGSLSYTHEHDTAMVFIHGTLSCGLQSLKDLFPTAAPPVPVYRFEHDTFLRVSANGRELASLIAKYIKTKRLVLVAHSRGGLVGRVTLASLPEHDFAGETHLLTFGTPHQGTPLVRIAKGILNLLLKVGSQIVDGIPFMTPVVAAASSVYDVSSLPDGIAIMEESAETLELLNHGPSLPNVRSWGGIFDPHKGESGFGFDIENTLIGAMRGTAHDLVVPTQSARAYGVAGPDLSCSHVRFFAQAAVRSAILEALVPPTPAPSLPQAGIHNGPTHVTAGSSRVMKRLSLNPKLAADSRLPRWFTLPKESARDDVSVWLRYSGGGSAVMTLLGSMGHKLAEVVCVVRPYSETPRRQILEVQPSMVEVIEYVSDSVFHVLDDVTLPPV